MHRIFLIFLIFFASSAQAKPAHRQSANFERLWDGYVKDVNSVSLQENCKPKRIAYDSSVPYRGIVFLFHGFTACPQQFFEMGAMLSHKGWDVFIPLLPGHGRTWSQDGSDDLSGMIGIDNWQDYIRFADQMNDIAKAADGERVIGGLSLGSAVAVTASLHAPEIYSRRILFSPFFDISNPAEQSAVNLLKHNAHVGEWILGWGESCSVSDRDAGRAGTCTYHIRDVAGIQSFGRDLLESLKPEKEIQTQFVAVTDDNTVSAPDIKIALGKISADDAQVSACFYPKGTNHSIISRVDSHMENKWWLPALLRASVEFISEGTAVPASGVSGEAPYPSCNPN